VGLSGRLRRVGEHSLIIIIIVWHPTLIRSQAERSDAIQRKAISIIFARAVATFEATDAAASVVFTTLASVKNNYFDHDEC